MANAQTIRRDGFMAAGWTVASEDVNALLRSAARGLSGSRSASGATETRGVTTTSGATEARVPLQARTRPTIPSTPMQPWSVRREADLE